MRAMLLLTRQEELALRRLGSQSASIAPSAAQLLVRLALAEPYRDGWRLTPLGLRHYQALPKSPLQREKSKPVLDDVLNRAIPLARAAGITKPDGDKEIGIVPWRNPPNRSDEYRKRADEARKRAETAFDQQARQSLLQIAETWERMAEYEDKHNPPRSVQGSH